MKLKQKKLVIYMLIAVMCIGCLSGTKADNQGEISQLEGEISENEKQYKEIQNQLNKLGDAKNDLEQYIVQLNVTYDSMEDMKPVLMPRLQPRMVR